MSTTVAGSQAASEIDEVQAPAIPEIHEGSPPRPPAPAEFDFDGGDDAAGRRALREQIMRLEQQLADTFVTVFTMGGLRQEPKDRGELSPRAQTFGELEDIRNTLAARLDARRAAITAEAECHEAARLRLEEMISDPASHRWARVTLAELGERGWGLYEVKPRLGLIGMLAGWWQVKSYGC